jgi:glycosyltransferase involved in cell wall biosynthesis
MRIAVVQHGDYPAAGRLIASGQPEPYFAMGYSLRVLGDLLRGHPHLVVSLDAPAGREQDGDGLCVGVPKPGRITGLPETVTVLRWAHRVRRELRAFAPTHLFLRTGGLLAARVLQFAVRRRLNTLAIFAGLFDRDGLHNRLVTPWLIRLLNDPCVRLVGNHRWPATQSMIDCGLDSAKAAAWDWPGVRHPRDHPVKQLPADGAEIVYVGMVVAAKGVGDLVEAVRLLHERGRPVRLTVLGEGADLAALRDRAASWGGERVRFRGRVGNEEVFARMLGATLVCVPSRPEFKEGFPLSLTESLASRTPVLASDHPVFTRALKDGEGVRFFRAGQPESLAAVAVEMLDDPPGYRQLSANTAEAFARLECPTTFGDLVVRWLGGLGSLGR